MFWKCKKKVSDIVNGIKNKNDENIWDETKLRELQYVRSFHRKDSETGGTETNAMNVSMQEKWWKRKQILWMLKNDKAAGIERETEKINMKIVCFMTMCVLFGRIQLYNYSCLHQCFSTLPIFKTRGL